ncbi:hypothetical protein [Methanonatronarchaeum sp. AMET6-2]|uniref:hypothetical protein n=1 Tax=Methanonatronarchaeum sp. AMET6-2 TaxID=2933293 RepID=UPI001FF0F6CB|nr:hypothetical protein [Methanonatronarchaeum sp. AMET6-2]UOY09931.1 hypothetical protein MU439_06635 [Methanonatronarchaeum sp. AMET6-2]
MELTKGEIIGVIGGVLAIIGSFLPWVSGLEGFVTVYGYEGDGVFTIAFGAIAVILILMRDWDMKNKAATLSMGILTILITMVTVMNVMDEPLADMGSGLILTIIGGAILITAGILGYTD